MNNNKELSISSELTINFDIIFSSDIFNKKNNLLANDSSFETSRRFIIIDENICESYLKVIKEYFISYNLVPHFLILNCQEEDKDTDTLFKILTELENFGMLRRAEPVIAIGGGVLSDVVGMAASIYRRGIPYIKIPTTLIGLIDASVGAKTGINYLTRRNRLGSYYPPIKAILDKGFLKTLEELHIISGLGEIFKISIIKNSSLFNLLDKYGQMMLRSKFQKNNKVSDSILYQSVKDMKIELENNLWEKDLKRCVDFGHSFSPLIEMRSLEDKKIPSLTHGQAVALDCIFSSIISYKRELLSIEELKKILNTARKLGLPTIHPLFKNYIFLLEALKDTMKHRNGNQYLPIPTKIGQYDFINDLQISEIKEAVKFLIAANKEI